MLRRPAILALLALAPLPAAAQDAPRVQVLSERPPVRTVQLAHWIGRTYRAPLGPITEERSFVPVDPDGAQLRVSDWRCVCWPGPGDPTPAVALALRREDPWPPGMETPEDATLFFIFDETDGLSNGELVCRRKP